MRAFVLLTVFLFPALATAQGPGDPVAGKKNYDTFCITCHGPTGLGDGPGGANLNPKPKNLAESKRTDEEMKKVIKEGGAAVGLSPGMMAWGTMLSDQDIANVIAFIRQFGKKAPEPPAAK